MRMCASRQRISGCGERSNDQTYEYGNACTSGETNACGNIAGGVLIGDDCMNDSQGTGDINNHNDLGVGGGGDNDDDDDDASGVGGDEYDDGCGDYHYAK